MKISDLSCATFLTPSGQITVFYQFWTKAGEEGWGGNRRLLPPPTLR